MPKAEPLTPDALVVPQITPKAATAARSAPVPPKAEPAPKAEKMPLQVRLPRNEVRAIKIAAAEREQTISDFMLCMFSCSHEHIKACLE